MGEGQDVPYLRAAGSVVVTKDEIADVQELKLWLELNGNKVQDSSTNDMIFPIRKLVSISASSWRFNQAM